MSTVHFLTASSSLGELLELIATQNGECFEVVIAGVSSNRDPAALLDFCMPKVSVITYKVLGACDPGPDTAGHWERHWFPSQEVLPAVDRTADFAAFIEFMSRKHPAISVAEALQRFVLADPSEESDCAMGLLIVSGKFLGILDWMLSLLPDKRHQPIEPEH